MLSLASADSILLYKYIALLLMATKWGFHNIQLIVPGASLEEHSDKKLFLSTHAVIDN